MPIPRLRTVAFGATGKGGEADLKVGVIIPAIVFFRDERDEIFKIFEITGNEIVQHRLFKLIFGYQSRVNSITGLEKIAFHRANPLCAERRQNQLAAVRYVIDAQHVLVEHEDAFVYMIIMRMKNHIQLAVFMEGDHRSFGKFRRVMIEHRRIFKDVKDGDVFGLVSIIAASADEILKEETFSKRTTRRWSKVTWVTTR